MLLEHMLSKELLLEQMLYEQTLLGQMILEQKKYIIRINVISTNVTALAQSDKQVLQKIYSGDLTVWRLT
jgi:hypothetical protein